jgi:hypothetical protein
MELDPRISQIETLVQSNRHPLWNAGSFEVATVPITARLEETLESLQHLRQLERGLEGIGDILAGEKKGLDAQLQKSGSSPANRISRLLLIGDDGSERFNRGCERILKDHADRVLGLRFNTSQSTLMSKLYGEGALAKVLLIKHREAVSRVLWSLL